jgi:2,4-dienoyl-CoA reductase-like NADH-dependent reductase (Old Yellow Enzyme family)
MGLALFSTHSSRECEQLFRTLSNRMVGGIETFTQGWKVIHSKGSTIHIQWWHVGRVVSCGGPFDQRVRILVISSSTGISTTEQARLRELQTPFELKSGSKSTERIGESVGLETIVRVELCQKPIFCHIGRQ